MARGASGLFLYTRRRPDLPYCREISTVAIAQ
jgi:hypothetical protein